MPDQLEMAEEEFEELMARRSQIQKELDEIDKKLKPLEAYLRVAGVVQRPEKQRRESKPSKKKS